MWGHPRRECSQLASEQQGAVNALKGKGKGSKGGKGKGYNGGTGKGYKGCNGYKGGYRSPGEAIGKGLNYYSNEDYTEAWGNDYHDYNSYDYDDCNCGFMGNVMMTL